MRSIRFCGCAAVAKVHTTQLSLRMRFAKTLQVQDALIMTQGDQTAAMQFLCQFRMLQGQQDMSFTKQANDKESAKEKAAAARQARAAREAAEDEGWVYVPGETWEVSVHPLTLSM